MAGDVLDDLDRRILGLLQQDARNLTPVDMADQLPVSDSTIRSRIKQMEEAGVVEGYVPLLNYEKAGFPLQILIECTATVGTRQRLAEDAREVRGIIEVRELVTGHRNVRVLGIATDTDDISRIEQDLEDLGFTVEGEEVVRHHYVRPFNHFGQESIQ